MFSFFRRGASDKGKNAADSAKESKGSEKNKSKDKSKTKAASKSGPEVEKSGPGPNLAAPETVKSSPVIDISTPGTGSFDPGTNISTSPTKSSPGTDIATPGPGNAIATAAEPSPGLNMATPETEKSSPLAGTATKANVKSGPGCGNLTSTEGKCDVELKAVADQAANSVPESNAAVKDSRGDTASPGGVKSSPGPNKNVAVADKTSPQATKTVQGKTHVLGPSAAASTPGKTGPGVSETVPGPKSAAQPVVNLTDNLLENVTTVDNGSGQPPTGLKTDKGADKFVPGSVKSGPQAGPSQAASNKALIKSILEPVKPVSSSKELERKRFFNLESYKSGSAECGTRAKYAAPQVKATILGSVPSQATGPCEITPAGKINQPPSASISATTPTGNPTESPAEQKKDPGPKMPTPPAASTLTRTLLAGSFVSLDSIGILDDTNSDPSGDTDVFFDVLHHAVSTETLSEYFAECQKLTDDDEAANSAPVQSPAGVNFSPVDDVSANEASAEPPVITNQGENGAINLTSAVPSTPSPLVHKQTVISSIGKAVKPSGKQKLTVTFADEPQLFEVDDDADAQCSEADETMAHSADDNALLLRIRQLEEELASKTQRLQDYESGDVDEPDRLGKLEALERLETELKDREQYDAERDEEMRLLQEALEEALEEKAELESRMARDGSRETQLLEDFEWKLHEIERDYKKKIADAEAAAADRVKEELAAELQRLQEDRIRIDEQLHQVTLSKSYEAEAIQLRGLVHEQQRALRVASRQIEQLRTNERLLQDDVNKLKSQGYTRKQQQDLEQLYEEKLAIEKEKLRTELITWHEAEISKALGELTRQKDDEIQKMKSNFEKQQRQFNQQVAELRQNLERKDADVVRQLESMRATADRDLMELRRHMNKLQDSHAEILEQLQKKHAEELEQCLESNSRDVLQTEFDEKLQEMQTKHQTQIVALQNMFEEEKQEALLRLGEHYQGQLQALQEHAALLKDKVVEAEHKNQDEVQRMAELLSQREAELQELQVEVSQMRENWPAKNISKSSSSQDAALTSSPPIGRSAGDGCSPSPSPPTSSQKGAHYPSNPSSPCGLYHAEPGCCNDPEHYDAQQFVLELQQVLADRDAELQRLTEEKRFYQLELIHWERSLVQPRGGVPLALVPDTGSMDQLNWRGYSAPPVTKPRLPGYVDLSSRGVDDGETSFYASSGLASPPPEEEEEPVPQNPYQRTVQGCWLPRLDDLRNPLRDCSDDEDDLNGAGFTTPLPYRDQHQPFFL